MRALFLSGSALICLALISAGCTVSEHEQYSTITIKDKFFVHAPNPFAPKDPRLGTWDYYVISESGETSRVSEDVYSSVFKNNIKFRVFGVWNGQYSTRIWILDPEKTVTALKGLGLE